MPGAVVGGSGVRRVGGGGVQVPAKEGGSITSKYSPSTQSVVSQSQFPTELHAGGKPW